MKKKIMALSFFLTACFPLFAAEYTDVLNKGILLLRQARYEESLKVFEEARKISPDNSVAYYYLGESLYRMGNTDRAIDNYNKAIEIEPAVPEYHFSLALVHLSLNNPEKAMEQLDKALELAPDTITGKQAARLKQDIIDSKEGKQLVAKWIKLEEEAAAAKLKEAEPETSPEGEFPDELNGELMQEERKKEDITKLIRKVRFGTETVKKRSASVLYRYSREDLEKIAGDMLELVEKEKDVQVKKDLVRGIGKAATPESVDLLVKMLQDKDETFDVRIAVLDSLSAIRTEEVITASRNTLNELVLNREAERKAAQKNIEDITKKTEALRIKKDELNLKNMEHQNKLYELNRKFEEASMPPEFMDPQDQRTRVSAQELSKMRREIRQINDAMTKNREEMSKIDREILKLQRERLRYESLLEKKAERQDITFQSRREPEMMPPEMMPPEMMPSGMMFPGMEAEPVYTETDEEKNEIIFAISLIKTLGKMRDVESLGIIKKGWEEYSVGNQRIYYLLALARLGDFSGMDTLISRLRRDYPQGQQVREEVLLRADIIDVSGDYLAKNPDDALLGLIEYLVEEGGYPEIRRTAVRILAETANTKQ